MTQLTDNIWAYPIPDEAVDISLYQIKHYRLSIPYWHINWNYPKGHQYSSGGAAFFYKMFGGKRKYPTELKFLFTTQGATEEDARKVVEKVDQHFWKCYGGNRPHISELQSLRCLLQEKQCDFNRFNFAILKNNING